MRRHSPRFTRKRSIRAHFTTPLHLEPLEDRCLPAAGLVLALGLDDGAGLTVADASGLGNAGTLTGPAWTAAGKFGGALAFDGVNDWVTVNDSDSLDLTSGMTLEAWVKPASLGGYNSVLVKESSNAVGLAYQLYANNGYPQPAAYIYTASDRMVAGTTALALDAWSHLAVTYDGAMLRLYVGGVQVAARAEADPVAATTNPLRIGGDAPFGEYFHGLIDEVRVYNRALSPAEIQADMAEAIGASGPGLPIVTIAAGDPNAAEAGVDPGVFTVSRTGGTSAALTVNYLIDGSAANGADFASISGSIQIPAGSASATIIVSPVDDAAVEGAETVVLTLAANAGYTVGSASAAAVTIADNDTASTGSFQESIVFSGLTHPTVVRFAPDGRVFVAEKSGIIKVFDSLADSSPDIFADLRAQVHNFWDRGLLGMALDPNFATDPYVYVLYSCDADIGGTFPKYGAAGVDSDPGPNATSSGALISCRLSRLQAAGNFMTGPEDVLIWDWPQQFPSHSIGTLEFGPDGALYAGAGDGASFNYVDYGQTGNPFSDPVNEGGALRSQDLRSPGDPVSLDGSIIRIDPDTGAGLSDNPLFGNSDANARRIVAYGLRNPFRFTLRPGTNEIWLGDVGWNSWEEINRIVNPTDGVVDNFGWPAYEGVGRQSGYDAANLPLLEALYSQAGAVVSPYYAYNHGAQVVPGSGESTGSSSLTGVAFYPGGNYPAEFQGALFFADYSRNRIFVMHPGANGLPDPGQVATLAINAGGPVYLGIGPGGDLFYCGLNDGAVHRLQYFSGNQPPTAAIQSSAVSGTAPLTVNFSGAGSTDPDVGTTLAYSWDLNGDGQFGDSTVNAPSFTYTAAGSYTIGLRVTDDGGLSDTEFLVIDVNSSPPVPVIDSPLSTLNWQVGQTITFSGHATDAEQGALPAASLRWTLNLHHGAAPNDHVHVVQAFVGVAGGSFIAPDHEYPAFLELVLTATDADGLLASASVRLDPKTVSLTVLANPATLTVGLGSLAGAGSLTAVVIQGSSNTISAATPQSVNNVNYSFVSWSDGGAATHTIVANASATYTATFQTGAILIGADSFGYKAYTTTYENLDLVPGALGVFTIRSTGDNNASALNIGNASAYFQFYGTLYTQLFISTNGLITLGAGVTAASNTNLTSSPSQPAIAPLWDDWTNVAGQPMLLGRFDEINGDGYYDRLVIEWNNVQGKSTSPSPVTFQAILQLNTGAAPGSIIFNYPDLNAGNFRTNGGSATVGIKAAGSQGGNRILVARNNPSSPYVDSGKAIQFVYAPGAVGSVSAVAPRASAPRSAPRDSTSALDQLFALAGLADELDLLSGSSRKKSSRR